MRTWTRVPVIVARCSVCGRQMKRGAPIQRLTFRGNRAAWEFCPLCAEGVPPPDLPPLVEHKTVAELAPMVPARVLAKGPALPFDYTRRLLGDREPGGDE